MSRLEYSYVCPGCLFLSSFVGDGGGTLTFLLDVPAPGVIYVGDRRLSLRGGAAELSLASLPDGETEIRYSERGCACTLHRLEKSGTQLRVINGGEWRDCALSAMRTLEEKSERLRSEIARLKKNFDEPELRFALGDSEFPTNEAFGGSDPLTNAGSETPTGATATAK